MSKFDFMNGVTIVPLLQPLLRDRQYTIYNPTGKDILWAREIVVHGISYNVDPGDFEYAGMEQSIKCFLPWPLMPGETILIKGISHLNDVGVTSTQENFSVIERSYRSSIDAMGVQLGELS